MELTSVGAVTGTAGCSNILGSSGSTTAPSSNTSGKSRAELQNRIAELQSRVESLQDDISSKDEEIVSLRQDLEELQERSNEKDQTARSLRSDLREAEARIEELEQSVEYQYSAEVRQSATDAGRKLREAVVLFEFEYEGNFGSSGTGWFIDQNHIITNRHVVQDAGTATSKTGYLLDGTEFDFSVSHTAEDDDIALVETDVTAPYIPPLGTASSLTAGQPLVQVGHPAMIGNWVISLGEFLKDQEFGNGLHTEMPSTSGNSGSPLITLDGTVVGLTYASGSRDTNSGPPTPSEEGAVEEYPYQEVQYSIHEGIDTVLDYYEQWTEK
ncbi:S1 family peptidase [Halorubrum sodomense]|uniref:S1 family peptidase n=1 Tax=Halorubrum sodomense TaxID=35743 RepID=UPI00142FC26C|nr:serine protease [Halorubrum sodomense]